jgi:hypothetical protein
MRLAVFFFAVSLSAQTIAGNISLGDNVPNLGGFVAPPEGGSPVPGVTITQLTDASVQGAPSACAIAYYDTPAYSPVRNQIFMGCGEPLTATAFDWKPWVMDADGSNKRQLNTKRINDPWGWTPDGTKIYARRNGLSFIDPDTGVVTQKIAGVVSGNLVQIGSNLYAVYDLTGDTSGISVWRSTDGGDSFTHFARYELSDPFTARKFHRIRASAYDGNSDGVPDFIYYHKECGNGCGHYIYDVVNGVSIEFSQGATTVPDVGHLDVMHSQPLAYAHWLVACQSDRDCGYIYPWDLTDGTAGTALNLPQWSGWTYRAVCCDETSGQLAMAKSVNPGLEVGLYDISSGQTLVDVVWPQQGACGYWCYIAPQMMFRNTILMRAPDENGRSQIWKVTYAPQQVKYSVAGEASRGNPARIRARQRPSRRNDTVDRGAPPGAR